ncbi:MAG: hypothetical protein MZV65_14735 [Chromatiales bacterium]|nr:hypothetical protein [Chromatiales bacterium]
MAIRMRTKWHTRGPKSIEDRAGVVGFNIWKIANEAWKRMEKEGFRVGGDQPDRRPGDGDGGVPGADRRPHGVRPAGRGRAGPVHQRAWRAPGRDRGEQHVRPVRPRRVPPSR